MAKLSRSAPSASAPRRAGAVRSAPHQQAKSAAISDAAFEIADRLHSAAIHLLRRVRREDDASGIPAPWASALSVLVFRGPVTVTELAAAEQVRAPTVTRLVSALERAGLAERQPDAKDRRVVRVRASRHGRSILEEARRRRIAVVARELTTLPRAELAVLERAVGILERIVGPRHWTAQR